MSVDVTAPPTFTGLSVENDLPVSYPIDNLEQLLGWSTNDKADPGQAYSIATVKHTPKLRKPGTPSTLVCHDMKGGYLDDRWAVGTCFSSLTAC